ncbi:MAG: cupredoxin domain-containing protein [Acidimicrobiales bacterium]
MRRYRGGALVLVLAGALLLSACSRGGSGSAGSPTSSVPSAATSTNALTISNFMFSPMSASVAPGATVRVTNKDSVTHTLTATGGQFDTGDIGPGQTKTFTAPSKAGTYSYICTIHQYMKGTIVVR